MDMRTPSKTLAAAGILALSLTGCATGYNNPAESHTEDSTPTSATTTHTADDDAAANYHYVTGPAHFTDACPNDATDYTANPHPKASVHYTGRLNNSERIGSVCSVITADTMKVAKAHGRQTISTDPAGWGHNAKVRIDMGNGHTYRGYLFNRSHLLADSLGGDPIYENLITGTRTQNVGDNNGGGMSYSETTVRDFLNDPANDSCPVTYEATPMYTGADDIIPTSVEVDMLSCDGSINESVSVPNTAKGYTIDYTTGDYAENQETH